MAAVSNPSTDMTQKQTAHMIHVLNAAWFPTGVSDWFIAFILNLLVGTFQERSSPLRIVIESAAEDAVTKPFARRMLTNIEARWVALLQSRG